MKVVGCQPYAPAAFTPRIILVLIFSDESTPGHMDLSNCTEKNPATPGIDPGTFRIVAQCLNPDYIYVCVRVRVRACVHLMVQINNKQ
jgi:hypothetical protein